MRFARMFPFEAIWFANWQLFLQATCFPLPHRAKGRQETHLTGQSLHVNSSAYIMVRIRSTLSSPPARNFNVRTRSALDNNPEHSLLSLCSSNLVS